MTVDAVAAASQAEGQAVQQQAQPEQQALSALQANIQEKADRSYYYAHRARVTSEEPAPPPVHVVLERTTVEAGPAVVTVFNYAFADEGDVVKVYIPLEGVGAACKDEDIKATFTERSLQVDVHNYRPHQVHRLLVGSLAGEVDPGQCRARKTANKVVVTLRKRAAAEGAKPATWRNLKSA